MGSAPFISNGVETTRNYCGINYTYDENLDLFIEPKPYESWILDESTGRYNFLSSANSSNKNSCSFF